MHIDLDAIREARLAKRREAGETEPEIRFGGEVFKLGYELPVAFGYHVNRHEVKQAFEVLLGDDFERFWALGPSFEDLGDVMEWVFQRYIAEKPPEDDKGPAKRKRALKSAKASGQ